LQLAPKIITIEFMNDSKTPELENDYDDSYDDDSRDLPAQARDSDLVFEPSPMHSFPLDMDIDAALAAVTSLSDVVAEREAEAAAQAAAEQEQLEEAAQAARERAEWLESYSFPHPSLTRLQRGQPSSVIPALLLIATGAYLTFALTLSDSPPAPGIVVLLVCGVVGLTLLSYWLSSGRWARGALFLGLALILSGGAIYYAALPDALSPDQSWTLLVGAWGIAALLTGLLAKPRSGRMIALGLGIIGSAAFTLFAAAGAVPLIVVDLLRVAWIAVLPVVALLMLLALVFRRPARHSA
jgi:hypothetical protein